MKADTKTLISSEIVHIDPIKIEQPSHPLDFTGHLFSRVRPVGWAVPRVAELQVKINALKLQAKQAEERADTQCKMMREAKIRYEEAEKEYNRAQKKHEELEDIVYDLDEEILALENQIEAIIGG